MKQLISELKNGTRQDYNRKIKELNRYTKRGAENVKFNKNGVGATEYELKNLRAEVQSINAKRRIEREKVENTEATSQGKKLGTTRKQMEDTRSVQLRPKKFNFNKIRSMTELKKAKENISLYSKTNFAADEHELYKQNYIKAIENSDLSPTYKQKILDKLKSLDAETVINTYYKEEQAAIFFAYETAQSADYRGKVILDIWDGAENAKT